MEDIDDLYADELELLAEAEKPATEQNASPVPGCSTWSSAPRKRARKLDFGGDDLYNDEPDSPNSLVIDEPSPNSSPVKKARHVSPPSCGMASSTQEDLMEVESSKEERVSSLRFEFFSGETISMRGENGSVQSILLRRNDWTQAAFEQSHSMASRQRGSLLSTPFWDLWTEARSELARRELLLQPGQGTPQKEVDMVVPEGVNVREEAAVAVPDSGARGPQPEEDLTGTSDPDPALWTEKYRPKAFVHLLSDEGINRTLLHWLKLWDTVVFGKAPVIKKKKIESMVAGKPTQAPTFKFGLPELNTELDEHQRPQQKVVLLCGPPGLGKTTLAHVIAVHAGYRVVELNASDDNSVDAFRTALENATQMRSVFGQNDTTRPNCLIIDEIDGAPAASINVLVNLIKTGMIGNERGGAKKEKRVLRRPIICICNELYVPALRPLRQMALVLHFPQTLKSRLATRLNEILKRERMRSDIHTLMALCDKAENDVRSCLSTLQFIKSRKDTVTMTDISTFAVGQKDVQQTLGSLLNNVFRKPRHVTSYSNRNLGVSGDESVRYNQLANAAATFGDHEKVSQALFDNYLTVPYKDCNFEATLYAPEWLAFVDGILTTVYRSQNFVLWGYVSYVAPAFYHHYSIVQPVKLVTSTTSAYERSQQLQRTSNLVGTLYTATRPAVRPFVTPDKLLLDILPFLLTIIQPSVRPVNQQLLSISERELLAHTIQVMLLYGITYQQIRSAEGQYQYQMEPDVETVVQFPEVKRSHKSLSYALRQIIARELDIELMRHADPATRVSSEEQQSKPKATSESKQAQKVAPVPKAKPVAESCVAIRRDFFGRVIQPKVKTEAENKSEREKRTTAVYYKFKEGFSNAVRRTIKIKQIL